MDRSAVYGNWRALVVDNKDKRKFGRVLVWIPDLMPEVSRREGIWARPANNPVGGRNMEGDSEHHYMGASFIPKKGSWLFVFFEGGNINLPYYFGALDLENTTVLPENQKGSNYEDKWTLFKSHEGRAIVISDDPDDERTEITGKKRQLKTPPTGDLDSVYTIDDNQTTILFDERDGKQKILIRTYKGDYVNIDIEDRKLFAEFESDIEIKTNGNFKLTVKENIDIKSTTGDLKVETQSGSMDIKASDSIKQGSGADFNITAQGNFDYKSSADINGLAAGNMNHDAAQLNDQCGLATSASPPAGAEDAEPEGERDS